MQKDIEINERDFFKNPFNRSEIEELLKNRTASEMFSFNSPSFKEKNISRDKLSDEDLIEMMLSEPRLIRRPVVKVGEKVYFGADLNHLKNIFP